ncbi:hypothetical protein [Salinimicrobium marinum]|uniref:hypothetical protein n=1 Tax=Salinimicrobium marinum TaxID=680283 RepID=UPI00167B106B|nr:hypothetical protein [Salinimicrobium marinum]
MRDFSLRLVKSKRRDQSGVNHLKKNDNNDLNETRLKLSELKEIKGFENISDDEGEAFIDDAIAFARMLIQVIL